MTVTLKIVFLSCLLLISVFVHWITPFFLLHKTPQKLDALLGRTNTINDFLEKSSRLKTLLPHYKAHILDLYTILQVFLKSSVLTPRLHSASSCDLISVLFTFVFQITLALRQQLHSNSLWPSPATFRKSIPIFLSQGILLLLSAPLTPTNYSWKSTFSPHLFDRHFINKFWGKVLRLWIGCVLALPTSDVHSFIWITLFCFKATMRL